MNYDAIILGGGIIGCTTAFFLARRGLKPLIIEPGALAEGTTANSFAWANGSTKTGDRDYHRLNAAGVAGYVTLAAEFGGDVLGINPAGALQIVRRSDAPGYRAMLADAGKLSQLGYPARLLDHAALCAAEPNLRLASDTEALLTASDMIIDAPRFTRFLADQVVQMGGAVWQGQRAGDLIADDAGVVAGVETDKGPLHAPNVILAAGPDTQEALAALIGYDAPFPMRRVPGLLMTTPPVAERLIRHLLYTSTTNELHLLPAPNGGLKIGSDDVDGMIWEDRSTAALRAAGLKLLERVEALIPGFAASVDIDACEFRIGVRPYPEDGKSIIGPLPGARGLYVIATHSGITLAPSIGALTADWLASGKRPDRLARFGLERFPGFAG